MAMRITRRLFLASSAVGLCRAQEPVFTADSRVVTLLANVRDADGKLVADLRKEDFVLSEDGKPLEIRYFLRETELPLTVGLLVDTSSSQFAVLERERRGAYTFLERVLRPDRDLALVISFDAKVKVLCHPTAALSDLRKGLNAADLPLRKSVKVKPGMEPKKKDIAGGTKLQTAVRECSDGFMLMSTGRKALLLLTDGVDEGSRTSLEQAIEHAQRADTLVYSILYADPRRRGGLQAARGRHILTELAHQTGGGFFTVTKEQTLEQIFDEIQAELRTQYSIGFVPDFGQVGKYRKLSLRTVRAGLVVRARDGYYAR